MPNEVRTALGATWLFDVVHVDFRGTPECNPVKDSDLAILTQFPRLLDLDLCGTGVGDPGLANLARLKSLRGLNLCGTHVTDAGLVYLSELGNLEIVVFNGTQVTRRGIARLKRALPGLKTSPLVGGPATSWDDWDELYDEVDEFIKHESEKAKKVKHKGGVLGQ